MFEEPDEHPAPAGLMPGRVAPGVYLLGRFGEARCGAWALVHGRECALVETPPARQRAAALAARDFARRGDLQVRYLLVTHGDHDHAGGLRSFRDLFPDAVALGHRSHRRCAWHWPIDRHFDQPELLLDLAGEPLLLLHAPKHSPEDMLVLFRGTCISGDWTWGVYPDHGQRVPWTRRVESLRALSHFLGERRYHVHTVFSSHANEAHRDVDFAALVGRTLAYTEKQARQAVQEHRRRTPLRRALRQRVQGLIATSVQGVPEEGE